MPKSHIVNNPKKGRWKGRDIINGDWSGRSLDHYSKDIERIPEQKIIYSETGGTCVDTVF
jgi:hypothetical protein